MDRIINGFKGLIQAIREINEKYKTPRIKTTRMVSLSLLLLRIYLIAMLILLAFSFINTVMHPIH